MRVVVKKVEKNYAWKNPEVVADNLEAAIKTFKRKVNREGILQECKKREFYVKPGIKRRLKHEAALKARRKSIKKRDY